MILDEAQRASDVFSAVKSSVDRTKRKVRFLISGSSNLLLMKRISETLAGRAVYFEMYPMSFAEVEGKEDMPKNFFNLWEAEFNVKEQELISVNPISLVLKGIHAPFDVSIRKKGCPFMVGRICKNIS